MRPGDAGLVVEVVRLIVAPQWRNEIGNDVPTGVLAEATLMVYTVAEPTVAVSTQRPLNSSFPPLPAVRTKSGYGRSDLDVSDAKTRASRPRAYQIRP